MSDKLVYSSLLSPSQRLDQRKQELKRFMADHIKWIEIRKKESAERLKRIEEGMKQPTNGNRKLTLKQIKLKERNYD